MPESRGRLLLVDDYVVNRNALSRLLRHSGFHVAEADRGLTALDMVERESYDLVLLDIQMPDLDGLSVLRRLREKYSKDDLPVVMVTAQDQSSVTVEAFKSGANDYVAKPIDFNVTLARIEALLARRDAHCAPAPPSPPVSQEMADDLVPEEAREVRVGDRLGSYTVRSILGSGGMGIVYEAVAAEDPDHRVALKVLRREMSANPAFAARFRREASSLARVEHPNVVAIYDVGKQNGLLYMAMQLVEGTSAQSLLLQGRTSWAEATRIAAAVCRGLQVAHTRGIIHRDIKPANILLGSDGAILLTDFGLAKNLEPSDDLTLTGTGTLIGTPSYMSPEQCRSQDVDARSDIYATGATYYALLTGKNPYEDEGDFFSILRSHIALPPPDPWDVDPAIPEGCRAVVLESMAKRPEDRYADVVEMLAALEAIRGA